MSKRAVSLILTFILTISILLGSVISADGEELEEITFEQATAMEELEEPGDTTEPSTTLPVSQLNHPVLTVNAISNYFGRAYADYNEFTREVTVTYLLKASKMLLTTRWVLSFDNTVLSISPEKNSVESICPKMKNNAVVVEDVENSCLIFEATNMKMFDFTSKEDVFARIVFDVAELPQNDVETTKVDLTLSDLWVSEPSPANGAALPEKNIVLISQSKVIEDKQTDAVLVSKITNLTASTFNEENMRPASNDQAAVTTIATRPVTVATQPATEPKPPAEKEKTKAEDEPIVKTGKWFVALLILVILLICSTVLFIMRKRDIYNN